MLRGCDKAFAEDRNVLQIPRAFMKFIPPDDLPPAILALWGDKLADPGRIWNATDVNYRSNLSGKTADLVSERRRLLRCAL